MLCMLCHVYEKCGYILHLAAKNVTANEFKYFSNKNKQTEIYTLRLCFKTQLKDRSFCAE